MVDDGEEEAGGEEKLEDKHDGGLGSALDGRALGFGRALTEPDHNHPRHDDERADPDVHDPSSTACRLHSPASAFENLTRVAVEHESMRVMRAERSYRAVDER